MQLDLSQDYKSWDSIEPVTYRSVRKTGEMADGIPVARRRPVTFKEMTASGGAYQAGDVVWLLPTALLSVAIGTPKEADVVEDGDRCPWTVLTAQGQRRDRNGYQTWKLTCRNLVVAYDLQDLVTIERAYGVLDAAGVEVRTWQPLYQALPCRMQPLVGELADERAIRGTAVRYDVFLSRDVAVDVTRDRVAWPAALGGYLEIKGYRNRERIDELPALECVLAP
ncbi:MAG: hypothetical protein K2R98_08520 [Gemmataceae bacterium]|nr:hypothetical protein [Gemmataceae bacterium]